MPLKFRNTHTLYFFYYLNDIGSINGPNIGTTHSKFRRAKCWIGEIFSHQIHFGTDNKMIIVREEREITRFGIKCITTNKRTKCLLSLMLSQNIHLYYIEETF